MFIFLAEDLGQSYRRIRYLNEYTKFQRKQAEIRQKQVQLENASIWRWLISNKKSCSMNSKPSVTA